MNFAREVGVPMERDELIQTLQSLQSRLQNNEEPDADLTSDLQKLSVELNEVFGVHQVGEVPSEDGEESGGLLDQMKSLTQQFEESHPQLAQAIGDVATALSRIGI
ncbi:DUF4404 family protein [Planctomicrobium sp. SH668]|uniref:DUF4404 family protein n=1 Tax=Planctomicrobium sp. SH668 TaxID=3448126 RepID=UPI003F5CA6EC